MSDPTRPCFRVLQGIVDLLCIAQELVQIQAYFEKADADLAKKKARTSLRFVEIVNSGLRMDSNCFGHL